MKLLKKFETAIILSLVFLLAVVITVTLAQVAWKLITEPQQLVALDNLFNVLSSIFMVLIGIELLETVKLYLQDKGLHVELILDVALIALARKIIVLEYSTTDWKTLIGLAAMILALGIARCLKSIPDLTHGPGK